MTQHCVFDRAKDLLESHSRQLISPEGVPIETGHNGWAGCDCSMAGELREIERSQPLCLIGAQRWISGKSPSYRAQWRTHPLHGLQSLIERYPAEYQRFANEGGPA